MKRIATSLMLVATATFGTCLGGEERPPTDGLGPDGGIDEQAPPPALEEAAPVAGYAFLPSFA